MIITLIYVSTDVFDIVTWARMSINWVTLWEMLLASELLQAAELSPAGAEPGCCWADPGWQAATSCCWHRLTGSSAPSWQDSVKQWSSVSGILMTRSHFCLSLSAICKLSDYLCLQRLWQDRVSRLQSSATLIIISSIQSYHHLHHNKLSSGLPSIDDYTRKTQEFMLCNPILQKGFK